VKPINDGIRFLVELLALVAVGYWGFHEHSGWAAKIVLGIGGPLLIATAWGIWMAPRSARRAPEAVRALLEVVIFGAATAALAASSGATLAVLFAVVAGLNAALDHALAREPASRSQPR
jgi:hypothetical protein